MRRVPIAITTSPACSTVSAGGWGWNVPSASRTPTMIAPPRTSPIGWPSPSQPARDLDLLHAVLGRDLDRAARPAGSAPGAPSPSRWILYGEITRVGAGAQQLGLDDSSDGARATIAMSGRSPRAVSVMKMLSASESTHAITPARA